MKFAKLLTFLFISIFLSSPMFAADSKQNKNGFGWFEADDQKSDESSKESSETQAVKVYKPVQAAYQLPPKAVEIVKPVGITTIPKIATPPRVSSVRSVDSVQSEVRELVELNDSINLTRQTQSHELQRVVEQARIHQQILDRLKEESQQQESEDTLSSKVREEKIKAISEETQKNKSAFAKTQNKKGQASSSESQNQPKKQGWFFG